ncbi:helix-turn-helix domain-containing protein [Galbibacter sp.]|uniref:helix-turn-helix domain-containing protein n=1 Tax=Galbibacter sp. TaxID=2918471 RepID=UPI003A902BC3
MYNKNEITSLIQHLIDQVATEAAGRLISTVEEHLETKIANALKGHKLLVDSDELAKQLMVSKSTVVKLRKQGLPTIRIGDSVRFDPEAVKQFIINKNKSLHYGDNK